MTILLTAIATLVVTILGGVLLDFIRNARPKVAYVVKDSIPIDIEGKKFGAYLVSLSNISNRVVKDITCHIHAPPAKLRNGNVSASQGLQYSITGKEGDLEIAIPFLKRDDDLEIVVIAEAHGYVPAVPTVAIRSPNDIKVVKGKRQVVGFRWGFVTAAAMAAFFSGALSGIVGEFLPLNLSTKDHLTFAASLAQLPHLTELYATAGSDLYYFDQGDLAYTLAADVSKKSDIQKYQKFLTYVIADAAKNIRSESEANLHYSLGKIDMLLGEKEDALKEFQQALAKSKSVVDVKLKLDPNVRDFLTSSGIHE